jgi:PST family polysaccharide transporter
LATSVGFALVADDAVPIIFGDRWLATIPLLQTLTPIIGLQAIFSSSMPIAMSLGATRQIFFNALIYSLVRVPAFVVGVVFWGLDGAIWSLVCTGTFFCLLQYRLIHLLLDIRVSQLVSCILRPIVSTMAMVIVVLAIDYYLESGPMVTDHIASILPKIIVGGTCYAIVHYFLWVGTKRPAGIESRLMQFSEKWRHGNLFS